MALAPLILTDAVESSSGSRPARVLLPSNVPLQLLLDWRVEESRPHWLKVIAGSLLLHLVFFYAAIHLPSFIHQEQTTHEMAVRRVQLYLPPDVLTQREPNKQKVSKTIDLADLHPAQIQQPHEAAPPPSRKQFELPKQAAPQIAKANPEILPEAPKVAMNQPAGPMPPGVASGLPAAATPPPEAGPFQNVGSEAPLNPHPTLIPKTSVQAAVQDLAKSGRSSHVAVSDDNSSEARVRMPGSLAEPAARHAAVELESDPEGADFKPYLQQILAIVRANWRRVVPESARMGTLRGRTVMEFIINRDGSIPKIVTASSSGSDPLDRAALAGLSMSNPLPPLPADYKGFQVRLAFTFSYNLATQ